MNGEAFCDMFYEAFKDALAFFGLRWNQKDQITVSVKDGSIIFRHGNRSLVITP